MLLELEINGKTGNRRWATLELQSIGGAGRLSPRLHLHFRARPAPYTQVILEDLTLRLEYQQEFIGEGRVMYEDFLHDSSQVTFEVVTSQRLLQHITDGLAPTETVVQLDAKLFGFATVSRDKTDSASQWIALSTDPDPGESKRIIVRNRMGSTALQVARTEWYDRVLAPTRNEQYRYLEIALPKDDNALRKEWDLAVNHLVDAERAYATGDDPTVFGRLRAALDSLPGSKTSILAGISDTDKREDLDALLKQAGKFLHNGRHVSAEGTQQGTFPVDHLDAALAIDLMRVLFSHLSLMLASDRRRAADSAS
ncbi:MAG: hypothetical protein MP439_05205 [Ferrimicrobium sp.]|jgi:hypothetical protein|nr:hypothetical protein [Ferrimicrobium sp.]